MSAGYICGKNEDNVKDVEDGKLQLVFFTPELLLTNKKYRKIIGSNNYQQRIKGLAI